MGIEQDSVGAPTPTFEGGDGGATLTFADPETERAFREHYDRTGLAAAVTVLSILILSWCVFLVWDLLIDQPDRPLSRLARSARPLAKRASWC